MPCKKASPKDKINWLNQHGGRNLNDLLVNDTGEYVVMVAGRGKTRKVYLEGGQDVDNLGTSGPDVLMGSGKVYNSFIRLSR